jgi:hypothetical protein
LKEEIWKEIIGHDGYFISNHGRVKSIDRVIIRRDGIPRTCKGKIIKQAVNPNGYYQVGLSEHHKSTTLYPHKLVAEYFLEKPDDFHEVKYCVNHKDGDKLNNFVDNLEWATYRENSNHSYNVLKQKRPTSDGKAIPVCIEYIDGTRIHYSSVRECERQTGYSKSHLFRILNTGKYTKDNFKINS